MSAKMQMRNPWLVQLRIALSMAILVLVVSNGCNPVNTQPTPSEGEPQAAPATPIPTATPETVIPAGWVTHTSQKCEYTIGYPSEMQVTYGGAYSWTLGFELANPEEGARNFVYVSVIVPELQSMGGESIYNYDPAEAETLLNMQVGESKSLHEDLNTAPSFTYQRQPDTMINGHVAQTYENVQPWEFPTGTKEIRYYLSLDGCIYMIGAYMDTTGSNQPGAITEELFHQIVDTIHVMP